MHEGCGEVVECFGPRNSYITLFGSELRFLAPHLIISVLAGLIMLGVFYYLNKKGKVKLGKFVSIAISAGVTILLFLLLAYSFPIKAVY